MTTHTVSGLTVNTEYSYRIAAKLSVGSALIGGGDEAPKVSATPKSDSKDVNLTPVEATRVVKTAPDQPRDLKATAKSSTEITLTWRAPSNDGNTPITGYQIESKKGSNSFITLVQNTNSSSTTYSHRNIDEGTTYAYKVFAINAIGKSESASNEATIATKKTVLEISPVQKITSDEEKSISFTAKLTDSSIGGHKFALSKAPKGASINESSGKFTWQPSKTDGGKTYSFEIVASQSGLRDTEPITIEVRDSIDENAKPEPKPVKVVQAKEPEPSKPKPIADFVKEGDNPQTYVDRYNNEADSFKSWFDTNYPQYDSIYEAVGLPDPNKPVPTTPVETKPSKPIADFVKEGENPQTYVDRYNNEADSFKSWFDTNYPQYDSIYEAVGLPDPNKPVPTTPVETKPSKPIADFVKEGENPQTYVDRYNNEADSFKSWFDTNYPQYDSIYEAVGLPDPNKPVPTTPVETKPSKPIADFVKEGENPQTYVDRYNNEADSFKSWFDTNYPQYDSIYEAVGLPDPNKPVPTTPVETKPSKPIADFVKEGENPQTYVDRYNNEADSFKSWFDTNYPQYDSIYEAVGLPDPNKPVPVVPATPNATKPVPAKPIANFVKEGDDPEMYVDRYSTDSTFKSWFDKNYPQYDSIYEAVGLPEPEEQVCGEGTKLVDGRCVLEDKPKPKPWWRFW